MESSKGHSSRKRKHSLADNYEDNTSLNEPKPGCSYVVTNVSSKESSSTQSDSHLDKYSTTNISSSSEDSSSPDSNSHLDDCSKLDSPNVTASSSHSRNTGSSHVATNIGSNLEESSSSCGGIHLDECSTLESPTVTASSSHSRNTVSGSSYQPSCYSELPEGVMHNVYRCLPLKDLIKIRNVCESWKHSTDKSSVWKHVFLSFNDRTIDNLSVAPYIHTVIGDIHNTELCVNSMVNNLQDLRSLNVYWFNNITATQVSKLISKFSNLECIRLNPSAPDIIETLAVLQNCPKLKQIDFVVPMKNISWTPIFNMLGKLKSLDTLDLTHITSFNSVNSSELFYLLEFKMKRLVSLQMNLNITTNKDIRDNISTIMSKIICDSVRLEKLNFVTYFKDYAADINLNFAEMKCLKSLWLSFLMQTQPKVLAQVTFPTSLEFLEIVFSDIPDTQKVLQRIIESCPNLKYLNASNVEDEDINEQLEHINRLQNLHTIILGYCPKLSSKGLQHIGNCSELRILKLTRASLDDTACNCLKSCKYLKEIELDKCDMRPKMLVQTILALERLTHLQLVKCYQKNGNKKIRFSTKYLKHAFKECKDKNPVLNISFETAFSIFRFNSFIF